MLHRLRRIAFAVALSLAFVSTHASDQPIDAVWKPQRATFVYSGQTTHYSCQALEQKLKRVLHVLGAHDDIVFDRTECWDRAMTRLHVTFRSPVVASVENIALITDYDARANLAARVQGRTPPSAEDLPRFEAAWQEVSFARNRKLKLDAADCEFVEHVRQQLLPVLSARVITNGLFCTPGYPGIAPPRLTVSALLPIQEDRIASTR